MQSSRFHDISFAILCVYLLAFVHPLFVVDLLESCHHVVVKLLVYALG
jgi:hypothetical protein